MTLTFRSHEMLPILSKRFNPLFFSCLCDKHQNCSTIRSYKLNEGNVIFRILQFLLMLVSKKIGSAYQTYLTCKF